MRYIVTWNGYAQAQETVKTSLIQLWHTATHCNTLQHTTTQAQDTVKASLIQASKGATKTAALEAVEVERGDGVFEVLGYIGRAVFEENYQQRPLTFSTEADVEDAQTDE